MQGNRLANLVERNKTRPYYQKAAAHTSAIGLDPPPYAIDFVDRWRYSAGERSTLSQVPIQAKFTLNETEAKAAISRGKATSFHRMVQGDNNYLDNDRKAPLLQKTADVPQLDISDDGCLVVEASPDTPKVMFVEPSKVGAYNKELQDVGSAFRLEATKEMLTVPDLNNRKHELRSAMPHNVVNKTKGLATTGPQQCIELAEAVMSDKKGNASREYQLKVDADYRPEFNREGMAKTLAALVSGYAMSKKAGGGDEQSLKAAKKTAGDVNEVPQIPRGRFKVIYFLVELANPQDQSMKDQFRRELNEYGAPEPSPFKPGSCGPDHETLLITVNDQGEKGEAYYQRVLSEPRFDPYIKKSPGFFGIPFLTGTPRIRVFKTGFDDDPDEIHAPKLRKALEDREDRVVEQLRSLTPKEFEQAVSTLGLNEYAELGIGQAFSISAVTKSTGGKMKFPYHWAAVVAKSGQDVVTLENYAREDRATEESDARWYFQLYGPQRKVTVDPDGKIVKDTTEDADYWKRGTFHGIQRSQPFIPDGAIAVTTGVGTRAGSAGSASASAASAQTTVQEARKLG